MKVTRLFLFALLIGIAGCALKLERSAPSDGVVTVAQLKDVMQQVANKFTEIEKKLAANK